MKCTHETPFAPARTTATMRLLVTGGTGVLGRTFAPLAHAAGHELLSPTRDKLDLFDPAAVAHATRGVDAVLHLATRIQPLEQLGNPEAWRENDRLRADASRILVDAALAADVAAYVQPTVTFVYPDDGPASEDTRSPTSRRSCDPRSPPSVRPTGSRKAAVGESFSALDSSTARARDTNCRCARSARPSMSPTRPAPCSRRSPSPAGSTTSAATVNAYPTVASRMPSAGTPGTNAADSPDRSYPPLGGRDD